MTAELGAIAAAIEAGESVRGTTSPNPPVGCALIDASGELIATGATSPAGGPHAEINALRDAGERARGATAVVTLEPCNHTGRTGPCSQALVALWATGARDVLVEGGATLAASFLELDLVDAVQAYIAPALLGAGRGVLDRAIAGTIADARRFRTTLVRPVGGDVFIEMERDVYGTR